MRVPAAAAPMPMTSFPKVIPEFDSCLQVPIPADISFSIRSYALPNESKPLPAAVIVPVNAVAGLFIMSNNDPAVVPTAAFDPPLLPVSLANSAAISLASSLSSAIIVSWSNLRI